MNYLIIIGGYLFLFTVCFIAAGILGRGWFLWPKDESGGSPRR
jgi:hypothetical protein